MRLEQRQLFRNNSKCGILAKFAGRMAQLLLSNTQLGVPTSRALRSNSGVSVRANSCLPMGDCAGLSGDFGFVRSFRTAHLPI